MSILSSHAASWHSDKWYRRAWYIWPQVASLLVVGWVFAGVLLKPNPPWAKPESPPPPPQARQPPRPDTDEAICSLDLRYSRDALLNACGRLIDKGAVWPYFMRARFYFWNGDYDRAIEDFSAFIHKYPYSDKGFNERGLSYAKKGEYDRAIADYTEAIRLNREPVEPYINRGSAYEKKGELDKALADFREALSHGSTTASEDIKRIEGAIRSNETAAMLLTASIGQWADGDDIVWRNGIGNVDVEAVAGNIFRNGPQRCYLAVGITTSFQTRLYTARDSRCVGRCQNYGRTCFWINSADAGGDCARWHDLSHFR